MPSPPIKTADSTDRSFSLSRPMLRSFLMACVLVVVPLQGHANPTAETKERDFLDLSIG